MKKTDEDVTSKVFNTSLQELISRQIGIMIRRVKEQMVVRGHFTGGAVAFGYDAVTIDAPRVPGEKQPKSLVPSKFAYAVAHAFALSADRHPSRSICDYLEGETGGYGRCNAHMRCFATRCIRGDLHIRKW